LHDFLKHYALIDLIRLISASWPPDILINAI